MQNWKATLTGGYTFESKKMPNTYQLFPGLKQILEDKRIRHFGVSDGEYQNYLMAEQFVVDLRTIQKNDVEEINKTYDDLLEMGLTTMPCNNMVIHAIARLDEGYQTKDRKFFIASYFFTGNMYSVDKILAYNLYSSMEALILNKEKIEKDIDFRNNNANYLRTVKRSLIVMLATRNIVKERKEAKPSQAPINGKPHKKGSGGYTLLRPPEAHEIKDGTGTHASPRPHFRRGHIRKLHPEDKTRWIFVSPCFVNGEPEVARKAYLVA